MRVSFVIPGRIGGKGRPRFSMRGGIPRTYTDDKTRSTEAMMREIAAKAAGGTLLEGPVSLDVWIFKLHPPSWSKKRKLATNWVTGKPDADNTLKLFDALNGIVWHDDSQVSLVTFERIYILEGEERTEVEVNELESQSFSRLIRLRGRAA